MSSAALSRWTVVPVRPGQCGHFRSYQHRRTKTSLRQSQSEEMNGNRRLRETKYKELMDATRLSLAPMMEYTDRHFRHVVRLLSSRTLLYTEMVAANSLSYERREVEETYRCQYPNASDAQVKANYSDQYLRRYLAQGKVAPLEGASVLQLGGSDPSQLFTAAETVMDMTNRGWCDYTAINLNCGCPSPKVAGKGCFGAALMDDPKLVSKLTKSIHDGCDGRLPVTVKCRIGTDSHQPFSVSGYEAIDEEEEFGRLCEFVETVASNGIVTDFSVHARIAVLQKSFSPASNRKIPPLKYEMVQRLIHKYPEFTFSLNGGLESISEAQAQFDACPELKGVMIGRAWAADPWSFAMADRLLFNTDYAPKNRLEVLIEYGKHADAEEATWDPVKVRRFIIKAVTTLFTGEPNAKRYRIALDEIAGLPKKLMAEGKPMEGQPPLSELIVGAASKHLSEEILLRTPEESYERKIWEESKSSRHVSGGRSKAVADWQLQRKEEEPEKEEEEATERSTA